MFQNLIDFLIQRIRPKMKTYSFFHFQVFQKKYFHAPRQSIKKRAAAKTNPELAKEIIGIQGEISKFDQVRLGVGLPPTHCATLSDKTKQYYYDHMANGVDFEYGKYHFSYRLTKCECYPQDYATIITYNPRDSKSIINNYESFTLSILEE